MAKHVHFLGIGGSGASAAAAIAESQGFEVTGCDLEPNSEFTLHIPCVKHKGHSASHIGSGKVNILAVTPAIYSLDPDNPELVEAKKRKIPVMTWQEFMGKYLMKDKFVIAIAGTHGKTTTTAMIAKLLEDAKLDPTVLLGAIVPWWGTNYRVSKGELALSERNESNGYFVIEADEYNDNFLAFSPDISVVTNIEMDHPEYFKDFQSYKKSFKKFLLQTKGRVVANLSDPAVCQMSHDRGKNDKVLDYSKHLIDFPLQIPGEFNRWNASAAYQVGIALGISPQTIKKSLSTYKGIGRRFEYLGEYKGAKVYSDFGHHPTEIKETMQAAREKFPNQKIVLIYEPHMFTRTKVFFDNFVKVFNELPVDQIIITDIYQSREVDKGLVNSQQLADAIHYDTIQYYSKDSLKRILNSKVKKEEILFFMGAGDIDKIAKQLLSS